MQYTVEKLNPLAFAKSQALTCELTGRPALFSLVVPSQLLTLNFVSRELAQQAWDGILCRIARELGQLLSPPPLASSEKERLGRFQAAQARKHALIEVCEGEAKRHIVHSRFELAIPAAMYALRFGTSIYGEGNVELVPAFLLLAEANLGLLNFSQAEEFLTKANWSLLKSANSSNALRSQLRRNFGKLYAAQGKYEEALRQVRTSPRAPRMPLLRPRPPPPRPPPSSLLPVSRRARCHGVRLAGPPRPLRGSHRPRPRVEFPSTLPPLLSLPLLSLSSSHPRNRAHSWRMTCITAR